MEALTAIGNRPHGFGVWWRRHVTSGVDYEAAIARVDDDAGLSPRYMFMTLMSAGIAILGLLQSSPAVVIGAMLISPLMGPIMGLGFAIALFDFREMGRSLTALVLGSLVAVAATALVTFVSPLQTVTAEIASRTRPNLFDLLIALFSALAGAYATIRGRSGTIVGVAIATALMPPLATVGFGLATWNATVFGGAFLLFATNFITIAMTAALMARLYGFGARLSPSQTQVQAGLLIAVFIALAVPLALALRKIAWESLASRTIRDAVLAPFPADARASQVEIDFDRRPIRVGAVVLTSRMEGKIDERVSASLTKALGRKVDVHVDELGVGDVSGASEQAQLAHAQAEDGARQAEADRLASDIAGRLSLIAGVGADAVTIDRGHRRAIVHAQPLPGASLAAYRTLEERAASGIPDWSIELIPPVDAPLPDIAVSDGTPDPGTFATVVWAARRAGLPVAVAMRGTGRAQAVADALNAAGVTARASDSGSWTKASVRYDVAAP